LELNCKKIEETGDAMDKFLARIKQIKSLLTQGHLASIIRKFKFRLWSETEYLGLLRDITKPFEARKAKIPLIIRPAEAGDIEKIKAMDVHRMSDREHLVFLTRLKLLNENLGTCYVAVSADNDPCYIQWLIGADENDHMHSYFDGVFPRLDPDEVLLEAAFTFENYRGMGIMPDAMSRIAEKAVEYQATKVLTFVNENNIPALKGCKRAGFVPHLVREERWRFFLKKSSFSLLPTGTPYSFDRVQTSD
jgi:hypothetical protein